MVGVERFHRAAYFRVRAYRAHRERCRPPRDLLARKVAPLRSGDSAFWLVVAAGGRRPEHQPHRNGKPSQDLRRLGIVGSVAFPELDLPLALLMVCALVFLLAYL